MPKIQNPAKTTSANTLLEVVEAARFIEIVSGVWVGVTAALVAVEVVDVVNVALFEGLAMLVGRRAVVVGVGEGVSREEVSASSVEVGTSTSMSAGSMISVGGRDSGAGSGVGSGVGLDSGVDRGAVYVHSQSKSLSSAPSTQS